ncbi:hypothetical protein RugamoR64_62120 [Duganella rhizosphaerae]|uniref:LPD7 domain-containing protein n=1 Tax=Duganella rhizosphaerae TaxID=2885763 RepID=UPI0030E843A8
MNSIEVTRSAKEVDQLVKDFEKDRGRKDLPALSDALMQNKLDIAQALIDRKADVNEYAKKPAGERGMAPIHFAQSPEAVKMLAAAGAVIDAPYKEVDHAWGMRGETKLQSLALTGRAKDVPVIDALLQAGADSNRAFGKEFDYGKNSTLAASDRIEREGATMSTRLTLIRENTKPHTVMQLSTKASDEKAYTLSYEGADFQKIMTDASKLQANGTDILVNEKANPHVVHAKTNLDKNVDIGRVIQPVTAPDGTYVKGLGEMVLPSFYDKLPIDTKAYDARQQTAAKPEGPQEPAKQATSAPKDVTDTTPAEPGKKTASEASKQPLAADKQEQGADSASAVDEKGRKIILTKTDYALPETVVGSYKVQNGKFMDKSTDALRFEDHGKKLSTPVEDRVVIADMIAVAAAKNWGTLELKGTENFKQLAWLEASARGMETKGYKPNERDLEQLDHLKRERGVTSDKPALAGASDKTLGNSVEVVVGRERAMQEVAADQPQQPAAVKAVPNPAVSTAAAPEPVLDTVREDRQTGKLLEHGPAKYHFNPKENDNYYVKLETLTGEKVIWGKDLERAISDAAVKPGEAVTLSRKGSEDVVVDRNKLDEKGHVVGREPIEAYRNKWEVKPVELKVDRVLSAEDKLKVDGIAKVMGKELAKYAPKDREALIAKLTDGLNNGTVDLQKVPTPKVAVRSIDKPAPEQTRDRGAKQEQARSR